MTNNHRELEHIRTAVLVCFFLSGLTGLVYEVLWIRTLGLVFGHTVFAITTVLTAFMGGLGLGSFMFGRYADRQRRLLRLYGILEIAIGSSCLLVPGALRLLEPAWFGLVRNLQLSMLSLTLAQFILVFLLLLVPTTLMGATLPVLSRFFVRDVSSLGSQVGALYALNTAGAVVGAALAGYFLLPTFGMEGSLYLTATLSIGIGVLTLYYDVALQRLPRPKPLVASAGTVMPGEDAATPARGPAPRASRTAPAVLAALALAGAASMIYEVSWTRALALVIGSSTYAFTAMLLAFLIGIAVGSSLFSRLYVRRPATATGFAMIQLAVAAAALVTLPLFDRLPHVYLPMFRISQDPAFVSTVQIILSIAMLIVPTVLIGSSFPCAVKIISRTMDHVALDVGRIYAVNTAGAIVGTVLAGFVLVPMIGAHATVKTAALLNLVAGAMVAFSVHETVGRRRGVMAGVAVAALAGVVWIPMWDRGLMTSGIAIYADQYRFFAGGLSRIASKNTLLYYEDGLSSTVSVHRENNDVYLRVNGKTDASTGADMHTQLMAAHIPLLLHPHPKSVLVIGLASGITVGAVAQHPVERIDVVEIEPAMLRASTFFEKQNRSVLKDTRVNVVIADGRNFLLSTSRRYDVIISEPSNPWIRGLATLFTEEFYELARTRLNNGGLMLQWVQGYRIDPADLRMVVQTFRRAFPAVSVWSTHGLADYFLLGSQSIPMVPFARIEGAHRSLATVRQDLERSGLGSAEAFFADFLLGEADTEQYARLGLINTDDLLPLEFSAPRSMYAETATLNFRIMKAFRTTEFPLLDPEGRRRLESATGRHELGLAHLRKAQPEEAASQFEKALVQNPRHVPSLLELAKIQAASNKPLQALHSLDTALGYDSRNPEIHFLISQLYQAQKLVSRATAAATRAVELDPTMGKYRLSLARLLQAVGRHDDAIRQYRLALEAGPEEAPALVGLGLAYLAAQRPSAAVAVLERARNLQPSDGLVLHELGRAYLAANDPARAVPILYNATRLRPSMAPIYVDLGFAQLAVGQIIPARDALEQGLSLDPAQARAAQALADVYRRLQGQP